VTKFFATLWCSRFFRFLIVGGIGTVFNLTVFYVLSDRLGINHNFSSIIAFIIAVTHNYSVNELWSFNSGKQGKLRIKRYLLYFSGNVVGLVFNILILNFLIILHSWRIKTLPQAIGIAVATVINFVWARFVVFQRRASARIKE